MSSAIAFPIILTLQDTGRLRYSHVKHSTIQKYPIRRTKITSYLYIRSTQYSTGALKFNKHTTRFLLERKETRKYTRKHTVPNISLIWLTVHSL